MNVNMVTLAGRLTRDVKLSYLPSQTAVAEIGLAINKHFKKQDGSKGEKTCFVDCRCFGKRAEVINKYFKKGDEIFITGSLEFDSWDGKDGTKRSKLRVFVENFEFVGGNTKAGVTPDQQQQYDNADDDLQF
jgi:single-strand DNA-binding protein